MTKRIFHSIFLVAIVVLIVSMAVSLGVSYQYFSRHYDEQLKDEAYYIACGLESEGEGYLQKLEHKSSRARITWVAADGTVLFDSTVPAETLGNHLDREEIRAALESGEGMATRYSDTLTRETVNYALRLSDGSVVRLSDTHDSLLTLLLSLLIPILAVAVVVVTVSGLLAYGIARKVTKPLNRLDFSSPMLHPETVKTYKELTPLLSRIAKQNQQIREQLVELERRRKEFSAITENMSEGLLVVDSNACLLSYNSGALRLLGATPTDPTVSVLTLNDSPDFHLAVEEALDGRHSARQMAYDDRTYQIIANPVYDKNEAVGAVLLILDVTEREARDRLRREFSANVSHELKTPLTSISGFAEMIRMGIARPEDIGHFAGKIHGEAQRLLGLIDDILKLSQLDENSIPRSKEPVDLSAITAQVADRLASTADRRSVKVETKLTSLKVMGVAQILDEMVYNLVENAIKYNKEGGNVYVTLEKEGAKVRLTVRDTGIGIPDADRQRVFERFYRVDKSHSKEIGGTGLGLSIVKHGAAFHGATLTLDSTLGQGTVISVLFPAVEL
ncbi:MAG: PAS domain-containing protein [Clostridia bacterium]|nr:PAS domain-containing protein [Clostridia bacterium]